MNYPPGTLSYNLDSRAYDFSGALFRLIPHGSVEPLSTAYSLGGGRWNAPNTFEIMYTFTSTNTARQYITATEIETGVSWLEVAPEYQPDLLVLDWTLLSLTDLATAEGLAVYNLPATYPDGFRGQSSWPLTQPIGQAIHNTTSTGLVARSASANDFGGAPTLWSELAVFPERATSPALVGRVGFEDWY